MNFDLRSGLARTGTLLWLTFVWVMLWGTWSPGTIIAGLLVAIAVLVLLPLPRVPVEGRFRPLSGARLGLTIAWFMTRASVEVAWTSMRPKPAPEHAVLRAPLRVKSDFVRALAVNTLNIIPGGIVVRIDPRRDRVYIHVFDVSTEGSVDKFYRQVATIERLYIRAFERPEDWRPSPLHDTAYTPEDEDDLVIKQSLNPAGSLRDVRLARDADATDSLTASGEDEEGGRR